MDVITHREAKPIPDRSFDWEALTSEHDIGHPVGYGPTEGDAVRDLVEQIAEGDLPESPRFAIGQVVTAFKAETKVEALNPRPDGTTTYRVEDVQGWLRADEVSAGKPVMIGLYAWSSHAAAAENDARPDEFVVLSRAIDGSAKSIAKARSTIEQDIESADRPFTLLGFATIGDQELAEAAGRASTSQVPAGEGWTTSIWVGPLAKVALIAPLLRNRLA